MRLEPSRIIWGPRLSVRAMMLVVLALGAWLGWITYCARHSTRRGRSDHSSRRLCGVRSGCTGPVSAQHAGFVEWLEDLIGIDYLSHVSEIAFDGRATDADLMEIGRLSRLERLSISSSPISDDGLKNLRGLTSLRQLFLHGTSISDEALSQPAGPVAPELLTLVDTKITDTGLTHLRNLHSLQELDVPSCISDRAIQSLQRDLTSVQVNRGLPYGSK